MKVLLSILAGVAALVGASTASAQLKVSVGQAAPNFSFTEIKNCAPRAQLSDYAAAGEIVCIKFWATT